MTARSYLDGLRTALALCEREQERRERAAQHCDNPEHEEDWIASYGAASCADRIRAAIAELEGRERALSEAAPRPPIVHESWCSCHRCLVAAQWSDGAGAERGEQ